MKPLTDPSDFDTLKKHVLSFFPEKTDPLVVKQTEQETEINSLKRTIGSQRFFFVVDMTTFEITRMEGLQRWLGYYEKEFTLKKYWSLVHPGSQKSAHAVFLQLCHFLCTGKFSLEFMVQRYSSLTPLKHYKGHYVLAKRTASVFQYDKQNRLTEYLNEFTIIGNYNGEPLAPDFFTDKGDPETLRGEQVMKQVMEKFLGMKIFSANELQVARMIAYETGIKQHQIATVLGKSAYTIDTYCKRFLRKARQYFEVNFDSVNDAALYLRKSGLL